MFLCAAKCVKGTNGTPLGANWALTGRYQRARRTVAATARPLLLNGRPHFSACPMRRSAGYSPAPELSGSSC